MKNITKFLLAAVFILGSTTLFAQKFGRIDYQAVIQAMPEMATFQAEMQKVQADYYEHLNGIEVELNRKVDELSKLPETTSETTKQLKNREIVEIRQRYEEYLQVAEEGLQTAQSTFLTPLQEKADAAVKKVCKADGIIVVFQIGSIYQPGTAIYIDEDATTDITVKVKTELGIVQ